MPERTFVITPAHDCTNGCEYGSERCEPGGGGFHGISAAGFTFVLSGEDGALSVNFLSSWYKRETTSRMKEEQNGLLLSALLVTGLGGVDWHWRTDRDYGAFHNEECRWLDGAECFSDGSGLMADDAYDVLMEGGSDALWEWMETKYAETDW